MSGGISLESDELTYVYVILCQSVIANGSEDVRQGQTFSISVLLGSSRLGSDLSRRRRHRDNAPPAHDTDGIRLPRVFLLPRHYKVPWTWVLLSTAGTESTSPR